jgi:hypothetical protein
MLRTLSAVDVVSPTERPEGWTTFVNAIAKAGEHLWAWYGEPWSVEDRTDRGDLQ